MNIINILIIIHIFIYSSNNSINNNTNEIEKNGLDCKKEEENGIQNGKLDIYS